MEPAGKKALLHRFANLAMLIGGFGLGQGSIFIAQTWLVATGRMDLLAAFGLHFSFAMLGIICVEAGSLTVLARQANALIRNAEPQEKVWQAYWETTIFRMSMALIMASGAILYALFLDDDGFSRAYLLWSWPAFIIWAFNAAGFLDGLQKSGISGITGSIAYMTSALALALSRDADPAAAGQSLGLALTIGYGLTVIVQQASLAMAGWSMRLVAPSRAGLRRAFAEEIPMLAGLLPGQFYFRIQLALAQAFLGSNATALLVYAKQIIGAVGQISGFVRRVEFPHVLTRLANEPGASISSLMRLQVMSLGFAFVATISAIGAGLIMISRFGGFTREAWLLLSVFSVTMATEAIGQSVVQILFGHGRFVAAAAIRIAAVSLGVLVGWLLISDVGVRVFVLSDLASHLTVILLSVLLLIRGQTR